MIGLESLSEIRKELAKSLSKKPANPKKGLEQQPINGEESGVARELQSVLRLLRDELAKERKKKSPATKAKSKRKVSR